MKMVKVYKRTRGNPNLDHQLIASSDSDHSHDQRSSSLAPSGQKQTVMSRRAAIVEEFDDDTDLPLPSHPLPNTGSRGPLLEEMHISDDEFEPSQPRAGPASPSSQSQFRPTSSGGSRPDQSSSVTDITPYKTWTCIYPIYVDAKRPYGTGQRRIERAKGLWWPLSKDIADAANRLGLGTLHEVNKCHPRDWENPGRVRVQWKKDGKLMNPMVQTTTQEKQLLEVICFQIQHIKPENIPKPPYNTTPSIIAVPTPSAKTPNGAPSSNKGKQPAATKSKSPTAPQSKQVGGRRLPIPPEPHPPLASRVSAYSPAISTGVLIETVKAGMSATEGPAAGAVPAAPGMPGGVQKGKRKVVRVRG
ncbi:Signal recognition particle SEC65 subunit [Hypsizygus marmoreus]|uniref:Signal recognition particle SEC65 subunit n=1 Tax=Hypsizygus marmoreus TaxID=39966 RepID=A0A369K986_HYPMA|nr:Signal recognition particle SEC65 subunit [Hypsizygus marmoreus]